jgi:hypothetical protein
MFAILLAVDSIDRLYMQSRMQAPHLAVRLASCGPPFARVVASFTLLGFLAAIVRHRRPVSPKNGSGGDAVSIPISVVLHVPTVAFESRRLVVDSCSLVPLGDRPSWTACPVRFDRAPSPPPRPSPPQWSAGLPGVGSRDGHDASMVRWPRRNSPSSAAAESLCYRVAAERVAPAVRVLATVDLPVIGCVFVGRRLAAPLATN